MVRLYARLVEEGTRTLDQIPSKYLEKVKAQIIKDGYLIDDDGNVTPGPRVQGVLSTASKE